MYEAHFRLQAKPFTLLPDQEFLYLGSRHRMALNLLEYGLANGSSFIVMTGEPGTGKTTLLNRLLSRSEREWTVGILNYTHTGMGKLVPWVGAAFGLETAGRSDVELFHEFGRFLERERQARRHVLLVLDEAQNVGPALLEELRLLSNLNDGRRRSLQVLLSGQPGLRDLLKTRGMEQFAQRVSVDYALEPLDEAETAAYIGHRLQVAGASRRLFSSVACRTVFRLSGGNPRLINQICDHALVYGYAANLETITASGVLDAARARRHNGMFPFRTDPAAIDLAPDELAAEAAEAVQNPSPSEPPAASDGSTAHLEGAKTYRAALALRQAGEFARAGALFDRLSADEVWGVKALAQKGLCLKAVGRYDEALATFHAALNRPSASAPDRATLRYLLGRTYEAMGRSKEALEHYRALGQNGRHSRDAASRIGRLDADPSSADQTRSASVTWLQSLVRSCADLLRTTG